MRGALGFAVILAACHAAPAPVRPPPVVRVKAPPPPPPPPPPTSPLHVIGWTEHVSDKTANPTALCRIDGALFVCGGNRVIRLEADDLVRDEALERGLLRGEDGALHGRIHEMLGRFPGDAWLVMKSGVNTGTEALYRYSGKDWTLAKKWKIDSVAGSVQHVSWKPGFVAVLAQSLQGDGKMTVDLVTKLSATPFPALPTDPTCGSWLRPATLGVAKDGALVVAGTRCDGGTAAWLRLAPGKLPEKHDGEPTYADAPKSLYAIVSSTLQRRRDDGELEEIVMPPPPVADASTLVPFQVVERGKDDVVVAASFRKERMTGVAILRTVPAKHAGKL